MSLLGMLALVTIVLVLAYAFTRFIAGKGGAGRYRAGNGGSVSMLEQFPLGKDQRLAVVKIGERYLVVGITPASITLVAELTQGEWDACRAEVEEAVTQQPSFQDTLKNVLNQRFRK